jgi:hypothetical protein
MDASDRFTKLGEQIDQARSNITGAVTNDEAELRARVDAARKDADDRAARMQANVQQAADQGDRDWNEVQGNWNQHVQRIRAHVEERKSERDAKRAERNADRAEGDALDAVDFAAAAIEEAEYAVLDAALARLDADALATAT